MSLTRNASLALATAGLAALGLAAAHPAAADTVVFSLPADGTILGPGYANASFGNQFHESATDLVTALGFYDAGDVNNTKYYSVATRVDIFSQSTGLAVATAAITKDGSGAATGGTQIDRYYFMTLPTPVALTTGDYINSILINAGYPAGQGIIGGLTGPAQTIGDSNISYLYTNGKAGVYGGDSTTNYYPNTTAGDAYLNAASFEVAAAPEPSQTAGLGMVVLGLGGLVLRARKRSSASKNAV